MSKVHIRHNQEYPSKRGVLYPRPAVDTAGPKIVSHAGRALLTETVQAAGLDAQLSMALARWRPHDPAKIVLDLAGTPAPGGTA